MQTLGNIARIRSSRRSENDPTHTRCSAAVRRITLVSKSTEILKNLLNHEIKHFSYPYGQSNQVSKREFNEIRDLNFDTAVTTQVSPIINSSPFLLPRMYVGRNTCAKTLINHLSGFYNLLNKIF